MPKADVYPHLGLPCSRQFILDTDVSDTGIGAVLSHVDGAGQERPIAYRSRLLT